MTRLKLIVPLVILLAAVLVPLAWQAGRGNLRGQMTETLSAYGFDNPRIGGFTFDDGYAVLTDIALDPDSFSTIRAIQAATGLTGILLHGRPEKLVIDDVRLTGAFTEETGLAISGWKKQKLPFPDWNEIVLTGGQLDLDTSAGALRFQAKGQALRQRDGSIKLQSLIWGVQNQMKIDSALTGVAYPGGGYTWELELKDGGLNLERIQASRMSGWLTVAKKSGAMPEISGQIDAGKLNVGDLAFSNFNLVFQGPLDKHSLIGKAQVYGLQDMTATLDVKYAAGEPQVKAIVETASLEDLLTFLTQLRSSETRAGTLTSLLLTQGNLDRLQKEIRQLKYDMLELQIYGQLYDLAGKIIVKTFKDGTEQRHVISLDPGNG